MKFASFIIITILIIIIFLPRLIIAQPKLSGPDSLQSTLIELKWSEKEVKDIGTMLAGKIFSYHKASEEAFKQYAPQANIIHLATHAVINDQSPMYSKLLFSPENDKIEDSFLNTYELYNMKLSANLAVLSACNTGTGKIIRGEGIMSLARGFMYAGCPNLVVSLWPVDDKSTALIMRNFYKGLKNYKNKDEALRDAKLDYLNNADAVKSNPFYWAGLIFIGETKSIELIQKFDKRILIFVTILALIGLLVLVWKTIFSKRGKVFVFCTIIFTMLILILHSHRRVSFSQNNSEIHQTEVLKMKDDFSRGKHFQANAQYDSSTFYFEKARLKYLQDQNWTQSIQCYIQIAENYRRRGEFDRAIELLNEAVNIGNDKIGKDDPVMAQLYNSFGDVYRKTGQVNKAFDFFNRSLSLVENSSVADSLEMATSFHGLGVVFYLEGNYEQAIEYHRKALSIRLKKLGERHPLVADNYVNLGIIADKKGDYETALEYYQKALSIRQETLGDNHPDIANSYLNLGAVYHDKGDYDNAVSYYNKVISIITKTFGKKHPLIAGTYLNIGQIYERQGDFDEALEYYQRSLSMILETAGESHPLATECYNNIGVVYKKKGNYDQAIHFYNKTLSTYIRSGGKHPEVVKTYINMGNVYSLKNEFKDAFQCYQTALSIASETFGEIHPLIAIIFNNLGIAHSSHGDYETASEYFKKAISIGKKIYGEKHPFISEVYQQIGELYVKQNELEKALAFIQESIIALVNDFQHHNFYINPSLNNVGEATRLLSLLTLKAEVLEKLYSLKTKNQKDLIFSLLTYDLALQLLDKIEKSFKAEISRLFLREQAHGIYDRAIETAYHLYEITQKTEFKEKAFIFTEKSKASVLRQALVDVKARQFAGIPDSLLKKERQLIIDLAFYNEKIFKEKEREEIGDSIKINFWQNKIFEINREYESLISRFERHYPEYYHLKYQIQIIAPHVVREKIIGEKDAVLEYFVGNKSIFIFILTKTDFDMTVVNKDTSFEEQVNLLRSGLIKKDYFLYTKHAVKLYQSLVSPIEHKIKNKNLIIIPDGILGYVPFETLICTDVKDIQKDYRTLPYLIKDYQISYNYSSSLLFENRIGIKHGKYRINFLGFAPVIFANSKK